MSYVLLDPALLSLPEDSDDPGWLAYWERISSWATDGRVKLGPKTAVLTFERYSQYGWPTTQLNVYPRELSREYHRALNRLVASVAIAAAGPREVTCLPEYAGNLDDRAALLSDITSCYSDALVAIATESNSWVQARESVGIEPPPPRQLTLITQPNAVCPGECILRARERLARRTIRIVGSTPSAGVCARLIDLFQIGENKIDWLPSSRNQDPRLASWSGISPARDVCVCVTGRISHACSERAKRQAERAGVMFILVETRSEIPDALLERLGG